MSVKTPEHPALNLKEKQMKNVKSLAALQAAKKTLEQDRALAAAVFAQRPDDLGKAKLGEIDAKLANIELETEISASHEAEQVRLGKDADAAIAVMESQGEIALQGKEATDRKTELRAAFIATPSLIQQVAGPAMKKAADAALSASAKGGVRTELSGAGSAGISRIGIDAGASYSFGFGSGYDNGQALAGYNKLVRANAAINVSGYNGGSMVNDFAARHAKKHGFAVEAANWYNAHLKGNLNKWELIPQIELHNMVSKVTGIEATDYSDPNNNLGILSGTLVLQRTLPVFKYKYPELLAMWTDFSDNPGVYNQTEETRIVVQPAVQTYNAGIGADGRALGWTTISPAITTNVTITLNNYVAVPISLGNNLIAATTRRLFDEQAVLAIAGIAGYFTTLVTNLMTAANFNYYAAVNGTLVPTAYATYAKSKQLFSMGDLDALDAIFTSSKVPEEDRGILLNPAYYAALRGDPRLEFYYAASAKSTTDAGDFVSEARLPKLSGFAPYKAGYMPTSTPSTNPTTNNVVGYAFQKSGILLKSRLPNDYISALGPTNVPGSITTVTDPDTGISLMLVQYVNLTQGYAEWRPEVMLGVAVGDNRAGLVLTSQ